jgi:hypothetical protein
LKTLEREEKWGELVVEYSLLEELYEMVRPLSSKLYTQTGNLIRFDVRDYSVELQEARTNAAEIHYQKGIHLSLMSTDASTQKQAAVHFKQAYQYIANYKDSVVRYEASRQKAIRRIAILPFEDKSGLKNKYGSLGDILVDQLISGILQDKESTEFVEIITRDQIDKVIAEQQLSTSGLIDERSSARIGVLLGAHEILSGRILQVIYVPPRSVNIEQTETTQLEVDQEDGDGKEKIEVTCKINVFTKTATAQVLASYSIVEVSTGRIISQETFNAPTSFEGSWARVVSGDQRALNSNQKSLVSKPEPFPPSEKEMVNTALSKLSRDIASHFIETIK